MIDYESIRASHPLPEYLKARGVQLRQSGSRWLGKCPLHNEQHGEAFVIEGNRWSCLGKCQQSFRDVVDFVMEHDHLSREDALIALGAENVDHVPIKSIEERRQRQEQAEAERRAKNRVKRAKWPQLYVGRTHDLQEVADLRGIDYAGPWLAQELGHLRFARWREQLAWVVGDRSAAAARRLDGKLWENGTPHKSDTLPGSEKRPIGLTKSLLPAILIEGEPDYLATLARLWQQGCHDSWQVVCMLGASARLGRHATKLRAREVTIYAHGEKAGQAAADRWKDEASLAGAKSVTVCTLPDGRDINDLTVEEVAA